MVLAVLASAWLATCPAYAAKESGTQSKEDTETDATNAESLNEARGYLKKWPSSLRSAFIALAYQLFFTDDGRAPYKELAVPKGKPKPVSIPPMDIKDGAKYVAVDGSIIVWNEKVSTISPSEKREFTAVIRTARKIGASPILSPFEKEVETMKQNFEDRGKSKEEIKQEKILRQRAEKTTGRDYKTIMHVLHQELSEEAQTAVLACLVKKVSLQEALGHSYPNSKGKLCFVYEQLQQGGSLEKALEILDKVKWNAGIRQMVLSKFEKKEASLKKGEKMRALLMEAAQKQYESYEAGVRTEDTAESGAGDGESVLGATIDMIDKVEDPLCRASLIHIGTNGLTMEQIFSETVLDAQNAPHTCYDALRKGDALDQAFSLMLSISEDKDLVEGLASHYASQCRELEKAKEKRDKKIQLALKQYEAKAAQKNIQELERE